MECGGIAIAMLWLSFVAAPTDKGKRAELAEPIGRLLDFSVEPSAKALQAVEHCYRSLPAATRQQPQVQYAFAVALIRQRRFQEASRVVHELLEDQPSDLAVWRAKIWIELSLDERTRAITDLEQLGSHAAAHQESETERLAEKESAEFFGAVCGFLAGPWSHNVREADVKTIEDRLRAVFDDESRNAFDEARTKVVERYENLYKEHEDRAQKELSSKAKELDEAKQSVGRKARELGSKQQSLKDKKAKRDADAKSKIADVESELKKIDQQRQALLSQIAPLEAQRVALVAQLLPEGPFVPAAMRSAMIRSGVLPGAHNRRIRLLLAPLVTRLTALEGQVSSLNQQELELRGAAVTTEIKHTTELGKLAEQEQTLDKERKRLKYDARRLKAKTAGASPRLRAEGEELTKFATYAPFPFEREKERLLAEAQR